MRKTLKRLFCIPFFSLSFHLVIWIISIISLPFLMIIKLVSFLVGWSSYKSDEQIDKERRALTEKEIEEKIKQWADKHRDKIKSIESKQCRNEEYKFNWIQLIVIPHNIEIASLKLSIGGPILLTVSIAEHDDVRVDYDTNEGTHNYSINTAELDCLLDAYLGGDYYIILWHIENNVIDKHLFIKNPQGTYTTNSYDLTLTVERKLATEERVNFKPA